MKLQQAKQILINKSQDTPGLQEKRRGWFNWLIENNFDGNVNSKPTLMFGNRGTWVNLN